MTGQNDAISVGIDSSVRAPDAALQATVSKIINTDKNFWNILLNTDRWLMPFLLKVYFAYYS